MGEIKKPDLYGIFFKLNALVVKFPALRMDFEADLLEIERKAAYACTVWNFVELLHREGEFTNPFFKPFIIGIMTKYEDFYNANKGMFSKYYATVFDDLYEKIKEDATTEDMQK